ncbi:MAG: BACON domain-containing protein, partial [Paludibacteraceae bacterium]|nr:BACON domain-containing protein [Paludibacteraceae bacterium]
MKRLSVYLNLLLFVALSLNAQDDCQKRTQEIDDLMKKGNFQLAKQKCGYYRDKGDCKDYELFFNNAINLCNKHLQQDTTHTEKPIKKGTFRLQRNKITIPANKDDGASELMFDISFIATPKSWEVESMPSWVEEISVSVKDKSASFFADDNTSFEPRAGEIVFTSENGQSATIQIVQEGRNMNFKADKRNLSYDDFGGTQTVGITAEGDWSVASNPSWILCLKEDEQLTVWCEQNGGWSREDDIVLTNDYGQEITITVRQDKTRDFLRASTSSFRDKKGAGGEGDITVSCNSYWSVAETNDWITATKNGDNLHIVVQPNKTPYERSGYVKLKSPKSNPYESRHTYGEV